MFPASTTQYPRAVHSTDAPLDMNMTQAAELSDETVLLYERYAQQTQGFRSQALVSLLQMWISSEAHCLNQSPEVLPPRSKLIQLRERLTLRCSAKFNQENEVKHKIRLAFLHSPADPHASSSYATESKANAGKLLPPSNQRSQLRHKIRLLFAVRLSRQHSVRFIQRDEDGASSCPLEKRV